jgi:sulfopyruvate decarboxylase subunit beta
MRRAEAAAAVLAALGSELLVAANGMISREAFACRDRPESFYMIGSMGLAAAIGLGVALARPERRVVVLDGDGNLLMGLGSLAMVGERRPANLLHVVLDNEAYGSTGGQRSISDCIALEKMAEAAGYPWVRRVEDEEALVDGLRDALAARGPALLLVKVSPEDAPGTPRVSHAPEDLAERFRQAARKAAKA